LFRAAWKTLLPEGSAWRKKDKVNQVAKTSYKAFNLIRADGFIAVYNDFLTNASTEVLCRGLASYLL